MPPDEDRPPLLNYDPATPPGGVDGRIVVFVMLAILGLLWFIGRAWR